MDIRISLRTQPLKKYKDGTRFEDIVELYYFDELLRQLFLEKLETLQECKDLEWELMENENVYLKLVWEKVQSELKAKKTEIAGGRAGSGEDENGCGCS